MGETQGGCWKRLRAAPPAYPLDKVKRSQRGPRFRRSIGPWPDRGSSLLRALMAASGCEWPRNIEQLRACPGPRGEWERDAPPATDFDIHSLRHWQSNAHWRGSQGPGSLMGHCNSVWQRLPLTAQDASPHYGRGTRIIFLVGSRQQGSLLSVCWPVATILPSYQVNHPSSPSNA